MQVVIKKKKWKTEREKGRKERRKKEAKKGLRLWMGKACFWRELRIAFWASTVPRYPQIPSAGLWPIPVHGRCFSGLPQAFFKEVPLGYWSGKHLGFTSLPQGTRPETVGVQSQGTLQAVIYSPGALWGQAWDHTLAQCFPFARPVSPAPFSLLSPLQHCLVNRSPMPSHLRACSLWTWTMTASVSRWFWSRDIRCEKQLIPARRQWVVAWIEILIPCPGIEPG